MVNIAPVFIPYLGEVIGEVLAIEPRLAGDVRAIVVGTIY
jgi:hypothetical protein